jgi:hypothetical protein
LKRRSSRCPSVAVAVAAALCLPAGGCARLVTVPPAEVARLDAPAWTFRQAPAPAAEEPPAVTPIGGPPQVPFRARPEVEQALHSALDEYGIPSGLYAVDPLLVAHRRELTSEASSRHAVAAGTIVFGLICSGLAAAAIAYAAPRGNSSDTQTQNSASQLAVSGAIFGLLGFGELVAGTVMAFSGSDPRPLQSYYRETYTDSR